MALFGGGFPPQQPAAFRQPPAHDANLAGSSSVHAVMQPQTTAGFPTAMRVAAADGAENDGGQSINRAVTAPLPEHAQNLAAFAHATSSIPGAGVFPALLGGTGAVVLAGGKRLRSARCGQCRGCNSGDCGTCKNCLDKPKFGGPGCRKQACMSRTCSSPRVVDDEDEQPTDAPAAMALPTTTVVGAPALGIAARPLDAPPSELAGVMPPVASRSASSSPVLAVMQPAAPVQASSPPADVSAAAAAAVSTAAAVSAAALGRQPVVSTRVQPVAAAPVAAAPKVAMSVAATPVTAPAPAALSAARFVDSPAVTQSTSTMPSFTPVPPPAPASVVPTSACGANAPNSADVPAMVTATKLSVVIAAAKQPFQPATPVCATAASETHPSKTVSHTAISAAAADSIFANINRTLSTENA